MSEVAQTGSCTEMSAVSFHAAGLGTSDKTASQLAVAQLCTKPHELKSGLLPPVSLKSVEWDGDWQPGKMIIKTRIRTCSHLRKTPLLTRLGR